jgi:hypothetical protein
MFLRVRWVCEGVAIMSSLVAYIGLLSRFENPPHMYVKWYCVHERAADMLYRHVEGKAEWSLATAVMVEEPLCYGPKPCEMPTIESIAGTVGSTLRRIYDINSIA